MARQGLAGAVPLAHYFLRERVRTGDSVVDATCGNGQDALLLAGLVGSSGRVVAFDVQAEALARTRARLAAAGLAERVTLVHAGHERLAEFVQGGQRAIVFNLGYLPAGDQSVRTEPVSTLAALNQAVELLLPGGLVLVAVYTGHAGGEEEWRAVADWAAALPPRSCNVWQARQLNRSPAAPFLVVVEKTGRGSAEPDQEGAGQNQQGGGEADPAE